LCVYIMRQYYGRSDMPASAKLSRNNCRKSGASECARSLAYVVWARSLAYVVCVCVCVCVCVYAPATPFFPSASSFSLSLSPTHSPTQPLAHSSTRPLFRSLALSSPAPHHSFPPPPCSTTRPFSLPPRIVPSPTRSFRHLTPPPACMPERAHT
jgi:hypothetical protein